MSSEKEIETSLKQYKSQLEKVEEILRNENSDDLLKLRADLLELINLTEGSLLSLKKSNLLSLVDNMFDAESHQSNKPESSTINVSPTHEDNGSNIIGMKCRIPYCHEWGEMSYYNAIISDVESSEEGVEMVRVVFCNPTHTSMLFCKYYAEGFCKFETSGCRFSHGYVVSVSDLKPFQEPCYENILIGEKCLAKDSSELWYKATIVDILEGDKIQVMFDSDNHLSIKDLHDIHPLANDPDVDSDSNDDDDGYDDDNIEENAATVSHTFKKLPNGIKEFTIQTTDALGQWEQHTKGIGSRLMLKMGYVIGEGLGKNSDGRALPVPIEVLPQGKSLDKIMEMRGKKDNAFKPNFKPKINKPSIKCPKKPSVFDVINICSSSKLPKAGPKSKPAHHISTEDLSKKSDKHINIQLLKTDEELRRSNTELYKLKDTLKRSIERGDKVTAKKMDEKIKSIQKYQEQLKTSVKFMNNQKNTRKAHKELVKF